MDNQITIVEIENEIKSATDIKNTLASILNIYGDENCLILMNEFGDTRAVLEEMVALYFKKEAKAVDLLNDLKRKHYDVCLELFGENHDIFTTLNDAFIEIEWILEEEPVDEYDFTFDQMVSVGVILHAYIITAYLQSKNYPAQWLDARDIILSNNDYRKAKIITDETKKRWERTGAPLFANNKIIVTQAGIGNTTENFSTTFDSELSVKVFLACI